MSLAEPRNPFYLLLLLVGSVFCLTALAYALVPVLEQLALDAGRTLDPSPFRDSLRVNGWRWLLYELAILFVVAIATMVIDRLRTLRRASASGDNAHLPTVPNEGVAEHE